MQGPKMGPPLNDEKCVSRKMITACLSVCSVLSSPVNDEKCVTSTELKRDVENALKLYSGPRIQP